MIMADGIPDLALESLASSASKSCPTVERSKGRVVYDNGELHCVCVEVTKPKATAARSLPLSLSAVHVSASVDVRTTPGHE